MSTLWETVTGNSSLPIASGTTFWDHLNNQQGGSGTTVFTGNLTLNLDSLPAIDIESIALAIDIDDGVDAAVDGGLSIDVGDDDIDLETS